MRTALLALMGLAVVLLAALTFASLSESNAFWVRMTDFPRLQYTVALLAIVPVLVLLRSHAPRTVAALVLVAAAAIGSNALRLQPYFLPTEVADDTCAEGDDFSVLVANVKLGNRAAEPIVSLVRERAPDVFVALETDDWWDTRLDPLSDILPQQVERLTGGYFGMHLMSARPLSDVEISFPVEQDTPAIAATVTIGDAPVRLIAVHPRPPHWRQPSTGRDAQLLWAALQAREASPRTMVAGDLNAVPWESVIERVQRIGGLLDPRRETGFVPSYDARSWWMVWPLDQILYRDGLRLMSMERLRDVGSDHYPIEARFCLEDSPLTPPALQDDDMAQAETSIAAALEGPPDAVGRDGAD